MKRVLTYLAILTTLLLYAFIAGPFLAGVALPDSPLVLRWWITVWQWFTKGFWPLSVAGVAQGILYISLPLIILYKIDTDYSDWSWIEWPKIISRSLATIVGIAIWLSWFGADWLTMLGEIVVFVILWVTLIGVEIWFEGKTLCQVAAWVWGLTAIALPLLAGVGLGWFGRALLVLFATVVGALLAPKIPTAQQVAQAWPKALLYLLALAGLILYAFLAGPMLAHIRIPTTPLMAEWWSGVWKGIGVIVWPPSLIGIFVAAIFIIQPAPFLRRKQTLFEGTSYFLMTLAVMSLYLTFPSGDNWLIRILALLAFNLAIITAAIAEARPDMTRRTELALNRQRVGTSLVWGALAIGLPLVASQISWWGWLVHAAIVLAGGGGVYALREATPQIPRTPEDIEAERIAREEREAERKAKEQQEAKRKAKEEREAALKKQQEQTAARDKLTQQMLGAEIELDGVEQGLEDAEHVLADRRAKGMPLNEFVSKKESLSQRRAELNQQIAALKQQIAEMNEQTQAATAQSAAQQK